jgi:hypothetical protein
MTAHTSTQWAWTVRRSVVARAGRACVVVVASLLYFAIRHLTRSDPSVAFEHARLIQHVQSRLGLRHEAYLQGLVAITGAWSQCSTISTSTDTGR